MKKLLFGAAVCLVIAGAAVACKNLADKRAELPRPEGPCDVYERGGTPCVAAHSTTRALYAAYDGPLYQVMRESDGKTLDIGVVRATADDPGGYADADAQDAFCKDTYCWITVLYDQSGKGNHLYQAPRGGFSGPAMGGYNNVPVADWAPVNVMGHKVYGLFIAPGMGLRLNDPTGTAVDDQAEGQYWVFSGRHYNSGCCFDYGNAETDSRDDGDGTMETTYFGNSRGWYYGEGEGPWIMTDQENNLVGCVNDDPNDKFCEGLESITWRFVTATADGEPHHWRSMGGNAQEGALKVYYDGGRIRNDRSSYDPMRKQGAILLGNGGDNEVFPSLKDNRPSNVQTFVPDGSAKTVVRFVNTTDAPIEGLTLALNLPKGWKATVDGNKQLQVNYAVAPGQAVVAEFDVQAGSASFNGDLEAVASWDGAAARERAHLKVRSTDAVKINEFSITDGFIELYNAGDEEVNLSGWTVRQHAANVPAFSDIQVPSGTKLAPKAFYVLGMAGSGLAVDAAKGDEVIYVRSVEGIQPGDEIVLGKEKYTVKAVNAPAEEPAAPGRSPFGRGFQPAGAPTTVWQPLPGGHGVEFPAGSTNIPVTSTAHFQVGQKMAIGYGTDRPAVSRVLEKYEVVTVTEVGKPGTQGYLSMDAKPGDTNIKVSSTANISVGDRIRLDINSEGHGIETVTVTAVGTPSARNTLGGPLRPDEDPGTGLDIAEPLQFAHASNMPYSVNGTGITFEPATKFAHYSNEPVLALCFSLELEQPLKSAHAINEPVVAGTAGFSGKADLLFGGPALSQSAGNITLRDAKGNVADALNYGLVVDPYLAEGYQADSGPEEDGNFAPTPYVARRFGGPAGEVASLSAGRFPDGADLDDNQNDFTVQRSQNLALAAEAGATNVKVTSVEGLVEGGPIVVGNSEVLTVAKVGTPGGTTLQFPAGVGTKTLVVASAMSFAPGQEVLVDEEKAVVAEVFFPRGWWVPRDQQVHKLVLASPLRKAHQPGEAVSGSGVTLTAPLEAAYPAGAAVASAQPTPGAANRY